jgi:hypothetical protein
MDIEEFNKEEEQKRQMRRELEKQKDKELINSIVDKEKGLDEIDKREKVNIKYITYITNRKEKNPNFTKIKNIWNI